MKLSIGIVGLPNVGKSTLFKLLTKQEVNIANYPFCTIDPNVGVVLVPDERLGKLTEMSVSEKKIPAVVEFYDIAGLVKGAYKGAGLGNQFLSHIREVNAIVMVLRCFASDEIIHVENSIDPLRDLEIINTELVLKDLDVVNKRLENLTADVRGGKKDAIKEKEILEKIKINLNNNKLIQEWQNDPFVRNMNLLSSKKQIYLLNGKESDVKEELKRAIENLGGTYIVADLADLGGGGGDALNHLIREAYRVLGLISFFTTGPEETRAWTITRGIKASEAAGVIHSDFEKKFIRAEVISWDKLLAAGGWVGAKTKGWVRLEGREYVVNDGDVLIIRHG